MNLYDVSVRIDGHTMVESPKCPSRWRGSGCYDVEAPGYCTGECTVVANTSDDAIKLAIQFDWEVDEFCEVDDVHVVSVKLVREGEADEAGLDVSYVGDVTWKEDDNL